MELRPTLQAYLLWLEDRGQLWPLIRPRDPSQAEPEKGEPPAEAALAPSRLDVLFVADAELTPEESELMSKMVAAMRLAPDKWFLETWCARRDRWPTEAEFDAEREKLGEIVARFDPHCIVTLGACAARLVFGDEMPLATLKSRWHRVFGRQALATYHPRDLIRQPAHKRAAWNDLQSVMARLGDLH